MKSITITQTRRTLSSEDLRLSESVVKPSHIMNVEASQHSPSVTVSIFDALADILTSTPRSRLSTTTEVKPKTDITIDVKQTLNGVSSNINVNSVRGLASDGSLLLTSSDVFTANTKLVQTTDQTTPINVINQMSIGESVTPFLNEERSSIIVNTPRKNPILNPTTPVSARRPFAIKVLYSEPTTDMTSSSPNQSTTDNPNTVYNTQSDILLSNNKLVSFELTRMLEDNINDLIKNLDEGTRSRLTVDMEKLLKSLIPRAVDGIIAVSDDVDTGLNTTPYSLEDILDTEITIDSINKNNSTSEAVSPLQVENIVQTVKRTSNVNTDNKISISSVNNELNSNQTENISNLLLDVTRVPVSDSKGQTTSEKVSVQISNVTIPVNTINKDAVTSQSESEIQTSTMIDFLENDTLSIVSNRSNLDGANNEPLPIPFFTNSKISDFTLGEIGNINDFISEIPNITASTATTIPDSTDASQSPTTISETTDALQNSLTSVSNNIGEGNINRNMVSPLQLWVLNKKAQVLEMIEDLIKHHNNELVMPQPLTDDQPKLISARLSDIMNNMNMTTTSDVSNISEVISTNMTFTPITPTPSTPLSNILTSSESTPLDVGITERKMAEVTVMSDNHLIPTASAAVEATMEMSPITLAKTSSTITPSNDKATTVVTGNTITPSSTEAADKIDTETTTMINTETIQIPNIETSSTVASTPWVPPKKDFVIFGILPNETVVRKDPNQDVLESLTEASPYIVYGVLPNNTIIRKFPNGTRVPRVMQKIDVLSISPWSLRNPYSPIHNNPAIVRPQSNPVRVSTNVTSTDTTNNGTDRITSDTVNNQQTMVSRSYFFKLFK